MKELLSTYNIIKSKCSSFNNIAISGSVALKLLGFKLQHEPEDLDIILDYNNLILLRQNFIIEPTKNENIFKLKIKDVNIDLILNYPKEFDNCVDIQYESETYRCANYKDILYNKFWLAMNSSHKAEHINELQFIINNNLELLN